MWSLSVEEQFYLIWPIIFVTLIRKVRTDRQFLALSLLTVVFICISELWVRSNATYAFYMAPARFFEFLLGAWVVTAERKYSLIGTSRNNALFIGGLVVCLASIFCFDASMEIPGILVLIPTLSVAAMIFSGANSRFSRVFDNPGARFLGKISYSLYLVHWPLVVFYKELFGYHLELSDQIVLVALSLLLAYLMWRYVEQKFRTQQKLPEQTSNKMFNSGLAASILGVIVICSLIIRDSGLTWRLDQKAQKIYQAYAAEESNTLACKDGVKRRLRIGCFGDQSKEESKVILIGDSHGMNFLYGLSDLFKKMGIKGEKKVTLGCPPIKGVTISDPASPKYSRNCAGSRKNVFNFIQKEEYEVVILAGRWALYTNLNWRGDARIVSQRFLTSSPQDEMSQDRSRFLFRKAMDDAIRELVEDGVKVIVFGQVPDIGFDITRCLFRPDYLSFDVAVCSPVEFEELKENLAFSNEVLEAIAKKYPEDVMFLDSSLAFCNAECVYLDGNMPLYKDDNHLLHSGSIRVVQKFSNEIKTFIGNALSSGL